MLIEALKMNPYVLRSFTSTVSFNVLMHDIRPADIRAEREIQVGSTRKVRNKKAALVLLEYLIIILIHTRNSSLPVENRNGGQ